MRRRRHGIVTCAAAALALFASCDCRPKRPPEVAEGTSWVGDCEEGVWVSCRRGALGGRSIRCEVQQSTGEDVLSGEFAFIERGTPPFEDDWDRPIFDPPLESLPFLSFDGTRIVLEGDRALVPDGWVDRPAGDGLIRRQRFELGRPTDSEMLVLPAQG